LCDRILSGGKGGHKIVGALTVLRQCPVVLLVEIGQRKGKVMGNDERNELEYGLFSYALLHVV
jgi:hypothetical protein